MITVSKSFVNIDSHVVAEPRENHIQPETTLTMHEANAIFVVAEEEDVVVVDVVDIHGSEMQIN